VWAEAGPGGFAAWGRARLKQGGARLAWLLFQALDLIGVPELLGLVIRAFTRASPLTGPEIAAAASVLGPTALRYGDVRVAEGGFLALVFKLNQRRAFTTFHTVNLPSSGGHERTNLGTLVHELVHVYQHERLGSVYIGQCLYAQATTGYDYGGPAGLRQARAEGKRYCHFNREQQAQIVQDYYMHRRHGWDASAYEPFIAEMRAGKL
jgi:hypothetical protein